MKMPKITMPTAVKKGLAILGIATGAATTAGCTKTVYVREPAPAPAPAPALCYNSDIEKYTACLPEYRVQQTEVYSAPPPPPPVVIVQTRQQPTVLCLDPYYNELYTCRSGFNLRAGVWYSGRPAVNLFIYPVGGYYSYPFHRTLAAPHGFRHNGHVHIVQQYNDTSAPRIIRGTQVAPSPVRQRSSAPHTTTRSSSGSSSHGTPSSSGGRKKSGSRPHGTRPGSAH